MAKPTAPDQSGRWIYTTNCQRLVGADKVNAGRVRIAALSPSVPRDRRAETLHARAVSLSKPAKREV